MAKGKKISLHNHFLVWKERSKSNTIERGSLVPFLPKINIKIQGPSSRLQRTFSFKKKERRVVKESLILSKIYDLVVMPSHKTRYAAVSCHNKLSLQRLKW
jgi:hypothetical protein